MRKKIIHFVLGLLCASTATFAQSKVFQEVSKDMETKVEAIMQDHSLVGYLIFNKLEKISKDSFSYKLNILDENLNDIGTFSFKNLNIQMQDVVFDQDVLCVGYLANNAPDAIKGKFKNEVSKIKSSVYLQFLNLSGELIKEYSEPVHATFFEYDFTRYQTIGVPLDKDGSPRFKGILRNSIQLKNIPNKGFCLNYCESKFVNGTELKNADDYFDAKNVHHYELFNFNGEQLWNKSLPYSNIYYSKTIADGNNLYLLRKNKIPKISKEGGYEILCLSATDGAILKQNQMNDKVGNPLSVLNFGNDIKTNNLLVSGLVINKNKNTNYSWDITRGKNKGVFSINVKDTTFSTNISNWSEGGYKPSITKKGYIADSKNNPDIRFAFSDENGNNYFVGSGIKKKVKVGSIIATVATVPLIFPPFIIALIGYTKYKYKDEVLLKQEKDGKLNYYASLPNNYTSNSAINDTKTYFTVNDNKYLVVNDRKDIFIYDVATKLLRKKIPHKEGSSKREIFKAKEGHIMISERNADNSTTLSIEAV